jgi:hypothetical protein
MHSASLLLNSAKPGIRPRNPRNNTENELHDLFSLFFSFSIFPCIPLQKIENKTQPMNLRNNAEYKFHNLFSLFFIFCVFPLMRELSFNRFPTEKLHSCIHALGVSWQKSENKVQPLNPRSNAENKLLNRISFIFTFIAFPWQIFSASQKAIV